MKNKKSDNYSIRTLSATNIVQLPTASPAQDLHPHLDSSGKRCTFCEFVTEHTRDAQKIYEDNQILAILDDYPIADGHTLVILKDHHDDLASVNPDQAAQLGVTVARLSKALKDACGAKSIYVASLGEQVRHVHYHLIPNYDADKKGFVHFLSQRSYLQDGESLVARIREEVTSVF